MTGCRHEIDVAVASRGGQWTEELRDHAASCLECAETALVVAALTEDVDAMVLDDAPLPDPRIIWIRSRLRSRQERSIQATRVMAWVQRLTIASVVVLGVFLSSDLRALFSRLRSLLPVTVPTDVPLLVSGPVAIIVMTFFTMGLMALWTERSTNS